MDPNELEQGCQRGKDSSLKMASQRQQLNRPGVGEKGHVGHGSVEEGLKMVLIEDSACRRWCLSMVL